MTYRNVLTAMIDLINVLNPQGKTNSLATGKGSKEGEKKKKWKKKKKKAKIHTTESGNFCFSSLKSEVLAGSAVIIIPSNSWHFNLPSHQGKSAHKSCKARWVPRGGFVAEDSTFLPRLGKK